MLKNRGKLGHFVENPGVNIGCFNQMWNVIHRTHGGDAFFKKSFKKPLTYPFWNDILIKLTRERAVSKKRRTLKIEQQNGRKELNPCIHLSKFQSNSKSVRLDAKETKTLICLSS